MMLKAQNHTGSDIFNKDECLACVEQVQSDGESRCTYCKGSEFFDNPTVCVCNDITAGFFGTCSDHTFGGDELTSKWDCQFGTSNGSTLIVVIPSVVAGVLSFLLGMFVYCKCRQRRNGDKSNTAGTTASAFAPTHNAAGGTGVFATGVTTSGGNEIPTGMFGDPSMISNIMSNPQALQSMLSNPMVQQMMQNHPQFANNPMMQQQMSMLASNPQMVEQISRMMSSADPNMMAQMMANGGGMGTGMGGVGAGGYGDTGASSGFGDNGVGSTGFGGDSGFGDTGFGGRSY